MQDTIKWFGERRVDWFRAIELFYVHTGNSLRVGNLKKHTIFANKRHPPKMFFSDNGN